MLNNMKKQARTIASNVTRITARRNAENDHIMAMLAKAGKAAESHLGWKKDANEMLPNIDINCVADMFDWLTGQALTDSEYEMIQEYAMLMQYANSSKQLMGLYVLASLEFAE